MNNFLLKKYIKYTHTDKSKAVLFTKTHLKISINYWIDIINYDAYPNSYYEYNNLYFRFVECGLYIRNIKPKYLKKIDFIINNKFDEYNYIIHNRAITWETANIDINNQKRKGVSGDKYKIIGVLYNKNKGKYRTKPPWLDPNSSFYGSQPSRWRDRCFYEYDPEWIYEIKSIKRVD